tara:strand:+ start:2199 stop:2528 length:330 start_codon:yes stop_codon:yes gene_type:complete
MTKQEVLEKLTELYNFCHDSSTNYDDGWMAIAGAISTAEDVVIKEINWEQNNAKEVVADSKDYEEKSCRCNKCMTVYFEDGLELLKDKDGFFKGCGVCKTDAHLMDLGE